MKEQNQNESTVDVELLKSQLLHRKITIGRFRLPYSYEQTKDMLLPHTRQKSNTGADISQPVKNLKANVNRLHASLREIPKSSVCFFSGMCGNGKTTWLKAIRTLINSLNLRHPQTQFQL